MRRRAPLAASLGDAFTVADAAALGETRRRLDSPDLDRRFRGVRMREIPPDLEAARGELWRRELRRLASGYRLRMTADEFFSHEVAAVIWGLPIAPRPAPVLDASVLHPGRAPRSAAIRGHQVRAELVSVVDHGGYRVTSPASTWAMLAATTTVHELVVLGDAIVHIPRHPGGYGGPDLPPLGTIGQLRSAMVAGRRQGVERLRTALPLVRTGSASRRETELRLLLAASELPEPSLDVDIRDEHGTFLGCSELAYPAYRVALEYEGDHHRVDRHQWNRDIDKQQLYAEAGWVTIRVTSRLLTDHPRELRRRVDTTLRSRGWHPEA